MESIEVVDLPDGIEDEFLQPEKPLPLFLVGVFLKAIQACPSSISLYPPPTYPPFLSCCVKDVNISLDCFQGEKPESAGDLRTSATSCNLQSGNGTKLLHSVRKSGTPIGVLDFRKRSGSFWLSQCPESHLNKLFTARSRYIQP